MDRLWQLALDQRGSANAVSVRYAKIFAAVIIALGVTVVVFGAVRLPAYPQFTTFHAGFVLVVDTITAALLFGQFVYRRLAFYAILASAYLLNGLLSLTFLLTFPGALRGDGLVMGGSQSSIWVWHFWHILFPGLIIWALVVHVRDRGRLVTQESVGRHIGLAVGGTAALVLLVSAAVTRFHDLLPVLITAGREPLTGAFYLTGTLAALMTGAALILALRQAALRRALHIWLAVALTALLADVAASLGAFSRYTVGWYFGRVESMVAASILLVVFITEIDRLYARLASTMKELVDANDRLSALVGEKEALVVELRASEEQIKKLAYYDAVTALPNRWLLMERLEHALAQGKRYGRTTAVLFMDLDEFKRINDTLGHDVGDALLAVVGQRLVGGLRSGDTASRLGGDEFVIVLPEIARPHDVVGFAEKVIVQLNEPIEVMGHQLHVSASIGIAVHTPQDGFGANELLRRADTAMYAAKRAGRNRYWLADEE